MRLDVEVRVANTDRGGCDDRIPTDVVHSHSLGTLSKDVFERRTSTGSEAFSLFICPDANKLDRKSVV